MVDKGVFSKLGLITKFISNNSFIFLVLLLVLVMIIDLVYGKNKKETKIMYYIIMALILIYGLFEFYKPLFNIIDVYITNIFKLAYFPSIIEYFSMILLTIVIQIISIKKFSKIHRFINVCVGIFIELLFIVNVIAMKSITVDLSLITKIYENDLLLSIYQLTGITFMLWIIYNIIILSINLFIKNRIEMPRLIDEYE